MFLSENSGIRRFLQNSFTIGFSMKITLFNGNSNKVPFFYINLIQFKGVFTYNFMLKRLLKL